jgi:hypothetical protein
VLGDQKLIGDALDAIATNYDHGTAGFLAIDGRLHVRVLVKSGAAIVDMLEADLLAIWDNPTRSPSL